MDIGNKQTLEKMEIDIMIREEIGIIILGKNMYQEIIITVNIMKVVVFPTETREINLKIILEIIEKRHKILNGTMKGTTDQ